MDVAIGTGRADLTPPGPVMLAGFGQRTAPSTGVHDRLEATALSVRTPYRRIVLVTTDLLCTPEGLVDAVLERLAADPPPGPPISRDDLCLAASHTHSGPVPYEPRSAEPGVADAAATAVQAVVAAVTAAVEDEQPSHVRTAVGTFPLLRNRFTPHDPQTVDPRVPVLAVHDAATGALRSVLFGVGCHPVTMGWDRTEVSADFPGVAKRELEARLGVRHALFVNTTEGDVVPATSPDRDALDPRGYCGDGPGARTTMGTALAEAVIDALRDAPPPAPPSTVDAVRLDMQVPPNHGSLDPAAADAVHARGAAVLRAHLGDDVVAGTHPMRLWAVASEHVVAHDLAEPDMRDVMVAVCEVLVGLGVRARGEQPAPVRLPAQVLVLDRLTILALPGEALVGVGRSWCRATGDHHGAFVVGLANGHLRYLPATEHFAHERAGRRYETLTAGVGPGAVDATVSVAATTLASRTTV